jgi:hypothetical protein
MDAGFREIDGLSSVIVADNWFPFYQEQREGDEDWQNRMPEFKPAAPHANRVRNGRNAQQYFNFHGTNDRAGLCQRVYVGDGAVLHFIAWSQVWSSDDDNDALSGPTFGDVDTMIGIDPYGGSNEHDPRIVWAAPQRIYDLWTRHVLSGVVAKDDYVTVFLASKSTWAVKHNDVYWDDTCLTAVGSEEPEEPEPSPIGEIAAELKAVAETIQEVAQMLSGSAARLEAMATKLEQADDLAEQLADML